MALAQLDAEEAQETFAPDSGTAWRARCVLLLADGHSYSAVCAALGVTSPLRRALEAPLRRRGRAPPVPYIEGWWVAPDLRGSGVGRALVTAVERWCVEQGYDELGSDVELHNDISLRAHTALGFEPTLRLQFFRKRLG